MDFPSRQQRLQQLLLQIPQGKVTTYKAIAQAMGISGYRFIGHLLHKNPYPDKFPCYKVIRSDGTVGGYALGVKEKTRRLKADGITIKQNKIADFENRLFRYP